ncbi:MAG: hypothetical protein KBS97_02080, partial [Firmicutes bacterium]|nr:hypothetical protein [Candidatus Fiminaster equi]
IGINKKLYDRRIELGYSLKEASIRLDISKFKLNRIESGYSKIKDKKLQERFIHRYKLENNFFESSEFDYPTATDVGVEEEISQSKAVKLFSKLWFKIVSLVLSLGFIALMSVGLYRSTEVSYKSFYSDKYLAAYNYAEENGDFHLAIDSRTSTMLLCNYMAIESDDPALTDGFDKATLNFFTKYEDYLGFAFFNSHAVIDLNEVTGLDFKDSRYIDAYFESRITDGNERLHFSAYSGLQKVVHFSADFDSSTFEFKYNLIETRNINGDFSKESGDSFVASVYKTVFENKYYAFKGAENRFFERTNSILHYENYLEFSIDQIKGINASNSFYAASTAMTVSGVVLGTVFFALFVLSIIITTAFGKKVMKAVTVEVDNSVSKPISERKFVELPKNRWPSPVIPEAIIRIVAFCLMVIGSMSLYYIFNSIINGDIIGTLESLQYRATVASFTTLGMILVFFIKLDIIQNKKSTFMLNFILFFAGFVFYVLTLLLNLTMASSPAFERFKVVLDFLPGNIVWGILAFNMLTSNLLNKPKFTNNIKRNTILYRLSALIPLGYMLASAIIQIGKKVWGWNLPFAVSSLFFTKALIITSFAILYCLVIFVYRRIINHKFGKENGDIYITGNRYQFIKNALVCGVLVILGLLDFLLGKNANCAKLGFGSNTGIFFLIPLVLLYHPHKGARNKKWDMVFNIAYGFSMLIGIVCILSSISVYITSL